ncbi:MAG: branched chain amino acid aminotransferase, partial [Actinomycetes bacterium]|nr:branched chain amino acid aminotransferase [Actinomycetes bacterium]MDX5380019.1 branched chain amino acid aminotransferase [Actinomycetes bacterium]MDX5398565.1 branched chain amino acid aminotransferase [Actinomycetes bacterium]MDX5449719.1 branched chain amino acid aminotransferase [Actinomycetes bacterium]
MSTLAPAADLAGRFPVHGAVTRRPDSVREAIMGRLSFGNDFTDHMARAVHTHGQGWHDHEL